MKLRKITKLNILLGWFLLFAILITQVVITNKAFTIGRMTPFIALLTGILFLPFLLVSIVSTLKRSHHNNSIKKGIRIAIFFEVLLPILLPFFFDKELIYLSLLGVFFGVINWYFRKKYEIQLLILNILGFGVWLFISLLGIL